MWWLENKNWNTTRNEPNKSFSDRNIIDPIKMHTNKMRGKRINMRSQWQCGLPHHWNASLLLLLLFQHTFKLLWTMTKRKQSSYVYCVKIGLTLTPLQQIAAWHFSSELCVRAANMLWLFSVWCSVLAYYFVFIFAQRLAPNQRGCCAIYANGVIELSMDMVARIALN